MTGIRLQVTGIRLQVSAIKVPVTLLQMVPALRPKPHKIPPGGVVAYSRVDDFAAQGRSESARGPQNIGKRMSKWACAQTNIGKRKSKLPMGCPAPPMGLMSHPGTSSGPPRAPITDPGTALGAPRSDLGTPLGSSRDLFEDLPGEYIHIRRTPCGSHGCRGCFQVQV